MASKAFVSVSEDSVHGVGQKAAKFLASIEKEYARLLDKALEKDSKKPLIKRTGSSLLQRYKKIKKMSLLFEEHVRSIMAAKPTGSPSHDDIIRAATACYNGRAKVSNMYSFFGDSPVDEGASFIFLNCYEWLKGTHLWKQINLSIDLSRDQIKEESVDDNDEESSGSVSLMDKKTAVKEEKVDCTSETKRPIGSKKAKEMAKHIEAMRKGADGIEGLVEQSRKRNMIAERMLKIEAQKARMELFNMEGTTLAMRHKFLQAEQAKALKMMEEEALLEKGNDVSPNKTKKKRSYSQLQSGAQIIGSESLSAEGADTESAEDSEKENGNDSDKRMSVVSLIA